VSVAPEALVHHADGSYRLTTNTASLVGVPDGPTKSRSRSWQKSCA
jgi:hypothetical protein